jgi:site-specific DNA-methyltransferase (adenine-specific)
MPAWKNKLYFGDNLTILQTLPDDSVDLIYLDPPFNSNVTYNVLFNEKTGEQSASQITAFEDSWHWGQESEKTFHEIVTTAPKKLADLVQALRSFLGTNDMMAYLTMMAARLDELRRVLKPTGSIYLHCDPTASHYLKLVMDAVFGPQYFQSEIIWKRTSAHSSSKRYGPVHDVILFFSHSDSPLWNPQYQPHDPAYLASHYRNRDKHGRAYTLSDLTAAGVRHGSSGQSWKGFDPTGKGNHWKFTIENLEQLNETGRIYWPDKKGGWPRYIRYLDEVKGTPLQDVWTDIDPVNAKAAERLGYPTQKPEPLLERIIKASSNEGDIVLDPFCGCGTAIAVAERLHRHWIGIDITHLAITLIKHRLHDAYGENLAPYEVIGDPKDLASAEALAQENRYQFEWWGLGLVDARPAQDKKKGADRGVDGYIYFFDDTSGKARKIIVQVKSGHVTANQIRDLKGTFQREQAEIGVFITLEKPTRPMTTEATTAGFYEPEHFRGQYPRLQILTIEELLQGKEVQYPRVAPAATFKKAERIEKEDKTRQQSLL